MLQAAFWLVVRLVYYASWESSRHPATPGARACHLRFIDAVTGDRPTFSQAALRFAARFFSVGLFGLGWLPVFLRPRWRALQ